MTAIVSRVNMDTHVNKIGNFLMSGNYKEKLSNCFC